MFNNIQLNFLFISLIIMMIIFISLLDYRKKRGVPYLLGLVATRIIYVVAIILEIISNELTEKLLGRNIQHTMLNLMIPFALIFILQLTGLKIFESKFAKVSLFSIFILWSSLVWLDPQFHLIFNSVELINSTLITTRTIYSKLFTMMCFLVLVYCFYLLIQYIKNIHIQFQKTGRWVLVLAFIPVIVEIIKFIYPTFSNVIFTFSAFSSFSGLIMLIIVLKNKFFTVSPIARHIVFDTLQDSIIVVNAEGKISDHNIKAEKWFNNLGFFQLEKLSITELLANWPDWLQLCQNKVEGSMELQIIDSEDERYFRINVYPIKDQNSHGTISIIFDITEKQRHIKQIANLNAHKNQLLTIISHDIRSPLSLLVQLTEFLNDEKEKLPIHHQQIISSLTIHSRNTFNTITNLLEWFRAQRDDLYLRSETFPLLDVLEDAIDTLNILSAIKNINIICNIESNLHVDFDREVLGLIVRNVLTNAIKFSYKGGTIEIHAYKSNEEQLTIAVQDNGVGMSKEQTKQLNEETPFYSSIGTEGERGAGLGLLVSRQFIQFNGGKLWVKSKEGEGSTFYFTVKGGIDKSYESNHC